jgi:glutamate N-acetyltransferase/amino-acid N-acetyltransferase
MNTASAPRNEAAEEASTEERGDGMSVTAPQGFRAAGVAAGLKSGARPDVALVVNDGPSDVAAAVFTANRCKANPVLWSERVIADGRVRAVVLNSGGANCYTGPQGFQNTHASAELTAKLLGTGAVDVMVCSTGLIGEQLDGPKLMSGIENAARALTEDGGPDAATAIMTTDTRSKQAVRHGDGWTIGGMAKGAGMLAPALATMLVVITTDAVIDAAGADRALREACRVTFDRLDSDGCMSTNDTVLLMSSGASGSTPDYPVFASALRELCHDLAQQLLGDAEGAEHDIAIEVAGAASEQDAVEVGRAIARSSLFKCAVFGNDPNWGRVMAAVGTTSAAFDPSTLDVAMNGVWICRAGGPGESRENVDLKDRKVNVTVDLKAGDATATIWTNDLTHAYVHENSAYST